MGCEVGGVIRAGVMRKVGPKKLGDGATVERGQVVKVLSQGETSFPTNDCSWLVKQRHPIHPKKGLSKDDQRV